MSQVHEIIKKHLAACARELCEVEYLPRAKKIVAETPTPVDDVILGALEPVIREALEKDFIKKLIPSKVV